MPVSVLRESDLADNALAYGAVDRTAPTFLRGRRHQPVGFRCLGNVAPNEPHVLVLKREQADVLECDARPLRHATIGSIDSAGHGFVPFSAGVIDAELLHHAIPFRASLVFFFELLRYLNLAYFSAASKPSTVSAFQGNSLNSLTNSLSTHVSRETS